MEQKNRIAIVIAITVLISAALFASFGRNLFLLNTPSVVLPTVGEDEGDAADDSDSSKGTYTPVELTTNAIQAVIATLERPDSYYREIIVEQFWGEDASASTSTHVQVWYDDGWTHTRQVLPSGAIRHDLIGDDTLYYWYDGSQQYKTAPADSRSADLSQGIPTYETVLSLDKENIIDARYEEFEGEACILVEVRRGFPERLERYWVSVTDGLLVCAEQERDGAVVYRMTVSGTLTAPCPNSASFALPNGTALHTVS